MVSVNAETGLITKLAPSGDSAPDNKQMPQLLAHDVEAGVTAETYAGDKAYDDTDLHVRLWALGKHSALTLNDYSTPASNEHRAAWQRLKDSPEYQAGRAERYTVERKFGEAKRWHGFGRWRYLGPAALWAASAAHRRVAEPEADRPAADGGSLAPNPAACLGERRPTVSFGAPVNR